MNIKKILLISSIFILFFIHTQLFAQSNENTLIVTIPDTNFKTCLLENKNINTNGDDKIQKSEAEAYHGDKYNWSSPVLRIYRNLGIIPPKLLDVSGKNISDLTGIEAFTNLEGLSCADNKITTLDVSTIKTLITLDCSNNYIRNLNLEHNVSLIYFLCSNNKLINLDMQNNKLLEVLSCSENQLENLSVSNNKKLKTLYCDANKLTQLSVKNAQELTVLYCNDNLLSNLDTSTNTKLQLLECSNNILKSINLTNNTLLTRLFCNYNQLKELSVHKNPKLVQIACNGNQLKELILTNNIALKELYCGVNHLHFLNIEACPNLSVLECRYNDSLLLFVTDIQYYNYAEAGNWYFDDAQPLVAKKAADAIINIPDAIFKTYLLNNPNINLNKDSEIQRFEAKFYKGDDYEWDNSAIQLYQSLEIYRPKILNISNLGISDLTGIEEFSQLQGLICTNNTLTELDLSNNTKLQFLYCFKNNLTKLNLGNNASLKVLLCGNNNLEELDINATPALKVLDCSNNKFAKLTIQNCPLLTIFNCHADKPYVLYVTKEQEITYSDTKIWDLYNAKLVY
ncbi:MAG: hypothetical protein BKP49_00240 [Treponema sp. CETP13]|nr:MAG: hypothetical protein BKP49_00240 [Treponema sp. CETP13]